MVYSSYAQYDIHALMFYLIGVKLEKYKKQDV